MCPSSQRQDLRSSLHAVSCYSKLSSDSGAHLPGADLKAALPATPSPCLRASSSHLDAQDGGC